MRAELFIKPDIKEIYKITKNYVTYFFVVLENIFLKTVTYINVIGLF